MKKGFSGNRKYIIFPYFRCTHGRLGLNVHLTMAHMKLEISVSAVSQNLVRLKGKGRQKKNKQTNEETRQQQKEKKQCCAWRLVSSLLRDDTKNGCVADYGHWRASSERLEQASWY